MRNPTLTRDAFIAVTDAIVNTVKLSDWETSFVQSVVQQYREKAFISPKQTTILMNIYVKHLNNVFTPTKSVKPETLETKRRPGRPKGSKNKPKEQAPVQTESTPEITPDQLIAEFKRNQSEELDYTVNALKALIK